MGRMGRHEGSHLQKTHPMCDGTDLQGSCPSGDSVLQRDEVGLHPLLGLSHGACKSKYSGLGLGASTRYVVENAHNL